MDLDVDKDSDLLEQEQRQDGGYWLDEERNVEEFLVVIQFFLNCVPHFWAYFASEPSISSVFYGKGQKCFPKL